MLIIKNASVADPRSTEIKITDISIENGIITSIGNVSDTTGAEVINADGLIAAPGFVDVHTHFRDPGFPDKETIHTGALAAAAGGYTTVVCMANTSPAVDNTETLKYVHEQAAQEQIHVLQTSAVTKGRKGEELVDMDTLLSAGAAGFTDDGSPILDADLTRSAMKNAARLNTILSFHEEDPAYIQQSGVNSGEAAASLGLGGADRKAEIVMVERDLALALETGCKIDIQHLSAAESVDLIRKAKQKDSKDLIHCEATPNHFSLTESAVKEYGTLAKINPPLRCEADRLAIIKGLSDGTIDMIATDHAPHTSAEKDQEFSKAPSGIIGLETALSLGIKNLVEPGYISMLQLIRLMSYNPAKVYGLNAGTLDIGAPADIVLFSADETAHYEKFKSRSCNSPLLGSYLPGSIHMTLVSGNIVYSKESQQ